jgi:hypothetical protein
LAEPPPKTLSHVECAQILSTAEAELGALEEKKGEWIADDIAMLTRARSELRTVVESPGVADLQSRAALDQERWEKLGRQHGSLAIAPAAAGDPRSEFVWSMFATVTGTGEPSPADRCSRALLAGDCEDIRAFVSRPKNAGNPHLIEAVAILSRGISHAWAEARKTCQHPRAIQDCNALFDWLKANPNDARAAEGDQIVASARPWLDDLAWRESSPERCLRATRLTDCDGVFAYIQSVRDGVFSRHASEATGIASSPVVSRMVKDAELEQERAKTERRSRCENCIAACRGVGETQEHCMSGNCRDLCQSF